jgi:hypothetical protein
MRTRVTLLLALSALLVFDGGTPTRPVSFPGEPASRDLHLDAEAVAVAVAAVNPTLSPGELDRIGRAVIRYSSKYALDPELVTAVIREESSGRPWVRSPKGAIGLMQVMPHMFEPLGLAGNPMTIETNIEAGCMILADNIARLGENDGVSAYFWGSEIRDVSYLLRVEAERAAVRRLLRL